MENNINDYEEIEDLLGKGHLMKDYHEKHFYFFSKTPFSKKSLQLARKTKPETDYPGYALRLIAAYLVMSLNFSTGISYCSVSPLINLSISFIISKDITSFAVAPAI